MPMLLSFAFGALRWPWWTIFVAAALGILIDHLIMIPRQTAWRTEVGLAPNEISIEGQLLAVAISIALSFAAYALGRAARLAFERLRSRQN
jgi:hypothetical protein